MQKAEEKAVACYQSGNFAAALRSFLNVLAEDPKREDILVYIANCYDGLGQKEEAVAYYRKALKANKKSDIAAANLAIIFYELQDYAEAQNAAERALKINPRNASALSVMGNLRYRKKDFDGALKFYQQAMETKRDFYTAVLNAASIYFERRDFNTAYFYAKRTVQSHPDSLEAQNLLAGVCIELGRSDEAILILSELYEKNPEDCWLCNLLSQAFQQKKEYDRALEMGWRAVVLSKGDNDQQINFYQYANAFIKQGGTFSWATDLGSGFVNSYSFYLLGSPFFWLSMLVPAKFMPWAMVPLLCLKMALAGGGAYLWARRWVQDERWSMLAGCLYAFSGFSIYNIFFNHFLDVVALFPYILASLDDAVLDLSLIHISEPTRP